MRKLKIVTTNEIIFNPDYISMEQDWRESEKEMWQIIVYKGDRGNTLVNKLTINKANSIYRNIINDIEFPKQRGINYTDDVVIILPEMDY